MRLYLDSNPSWIPSGVVSLATMQQSREATRKFAFLVLSALEDLTHQSEHDFMEMQVADETVSLRWFRGQGCQGHRFRSRRSRLQGVGLDPGQHASVWPGGVVLD